VPGTLYLCGTPIGNLEDMTFRAVRVLREVKAIAAEDTRRTRKLLAHFDIKTPLVSYHEHNKEERGPALLARLAAGEDIAVVSDAGMPGIADPGADLVRQAVAAGVPVVPVVGANAALAAVVASGLDTGIIHFLGFLPRTAKRRRDVLAVAAAWPGTLVLYEAPHRLLATIRELGWSKDDLLWVKNAIPYYIFGKHVAMPPQRRWNTGEKLNVWIMVAGTITFGITGVVMWFGRGIVPTWLFQVAVIVHDLTMIVTVNMFIVHFFLAVVHPLMWQSLVSMRFGVVSESYAREHHAAWFYGEKRAKELYAQRLAQEQAKAQGGAGEK